VDDASAQILERWDALVRQNEALAWRHMRVTQMLQQDEFLHALLRATPEARAALVYSLTGGWTGPAPSLLGWMREPGSWAIQ
jgi:hypothetical protein